MQKLVDIILSGKKSELKYSKYFVLRYQFNRTDLPEDIYLLEWLLTHNLSEIMYSNGSTGEIELENIPNIQCFLVLRTLVSLAAYTKWNPDFQFSEYFQFGIVGDTTPQQVYDLAKNVAEDLYNLQSKDPFNSQLVDHMENLVHQLEPGAFKPEADFEDEGVIQFGEFEQNPFWEFPITWAQKSKQVLLPKINDPFSCLVRATSKPKEVEPELEEVEEPVVKIPENIFKRAKIQIEDRPLDVPPDKLPDLPPPPVRKGIVQSKLFKKSDLLPQGPEDFMKRLIDEVKSDEAFEGGI